MGMRGLMLEALQNLKDQEGGFKTELWNDFYFGHIHISEFEPAGIPTDGLFLDYYNEVMRWFHAKK